MTDITQENPLSQLCHRIRSLTNTEYPKIRSQIQIASLMGGANIQSKISKRLKELDTLIYLAEASLSEYCEALAQPWNWPPPERRNDPTPEDFL